jgi:hypothetical protein
MQPARHMRQARSLPPQDARTRQVVIETNLPVVFTQTIPSEAHLNNQKGPRRNFNCLPI